MSLFDFESKDEPVQQDVNLVAGIFECMVCYEEVRRAKHIPEKHIIRYVCSKGHKSEASYV